ncbi:unnamed protein product [Sphenostylis stenocarpa]|uniref:Legume lectin domain-containing protein n=1 Tax=Sphenostylis stenocarpa TaxID=92480 RepID=A0AA87B9G4_9FABA|nr:unnamed protein product [Sphenostylis stenocarpa]
MATSNTNASPNKPSFLIPLLAFVTMLFMFPNTVKSAHNNVIQLTKLDSNGNPVTGSVGRVLYSAPLRLWESSTVVSTFETTFTFQISTPYTTPLADGFALFLAPYDTVIPPNSGGNLL